MRISSKKIEITSQRRKCAMNGKVQWCILNNNKPTNQASSPSILDKQDVVREMHQHNNRKRSARHFMNSDFSRIFPKQDVWFTLSECPNGCYWLKMLTFFLHNFPVLFRAGVHSKGFSRKSSIHTHTLWDSAHRKSSPLTPRGLMDAGKFVSFFASISASYA